MWTSSPAVAGGVVYIGSTDGNMYAFSSLGQQSSSVSVSCSPNPASAGSVVTCTATVSGSNPIGTVTWSTNSSTGSFSSNVASGISIPAPLISGTSTVTYTDTSPGTVTITATYNGDTNNAPSSGTAPLTMSGFVVSGYVLAPNGTGVANAGVNLGNSTGWGTGTQTDTSGYYSLAVPIPGGTYNFNVNVPPRSNLVNYQTSLDVTGNMVWNVTLSSGFIVSGYVLAPNGTGVANVGVNLGNNTWNTGTQTDASGYYSLAVPPGTYNFNVNVPPGSGFLNYQESGVVVSANLIMNVTLSSGFVVSGYVLAPNGTGVANAGVNLGNNTWNTGTQTDESGFYSLAVPPGTYNFNTNVPPGSNLVNYQASGVVVSGNMVMNVTLSSGFVVSGYVLAPNGAGVAYVGVNLGNNTWNTGTQTNESGYYSLAVPAGTYNFNVNVPPGSGFLNYQTPLDVTGNMMMNVTLSSGFVVSGYVLAPNGTGVANAGVNLGNNTGWGTGTQTDASGFYSLAAPAGTYNFNVNPPPGSDFVTYQTSLDVSSEHAYERDAVKRLYCFWLCFGS